jgi:hypothetical protein
MKRRVCGVVVMVAAACAANQAFGQTVFNGRNIAGTNLDASGFIPPDTMGAVGRDHYVELVNGRYAVYRKSDGVRLQDMSLSMFVTGGGAAIVGSAFDPRVLYDAYSDRWFAVTVDNARSANSYQVSVSKTSDPTDGWRSFRIDSDADNNRWADFPMLGINASYVTISANMFGLSGATTATSIVVLDKAGLLTTDPSTAARTEFQDIDPAITGTTMQPVWDLDNAAGNPQFLSANTTSTHRFSTAGVLGTPNVVASATVPVATFANPPTADQPGTKANLNTGDTRFSGSVIKNGADIWSVHTIDVSGRAGLRWYRYDSATKALISSGTISDATRALMFPSLAVNDFGEIMIGFSTSSPTQFASASYVVGTVSGNGANFGAIQNFQTGVADYLRLDLSGRNRWGDYSATHTDPCDPSIFWTIQEYVDSVDSWATRVGEFILPRPNEVRWANPANGSFATAANWFGGVAPISTSKLVFSRSTTPGSAGYSVSMPGGARSANSLRIHQGKVAIDLAGGSLQLTNPTSSLIIGEFAGTPAVTISNGSLSAPELLIATSAQSRGSSLETSANVSVTTMVVGGFPNVAGGFGTYLALGTFAASGNVTVYPGSSLASTGSSFTVGSQFRLNGSAGFLAASSSLGTVVGTGSLTINAGTHNARSLVLGSLTLNGGSLTIQANAPAVQLDTLSNIGLLDLNNNDMIIDYAGATPIASIIEQFLAGRIVVDGAVAGLPTYLAVAEAADLGLASFSGVAVDSEAVVCKFTYVGDANLDGQVDALDYERVDLAIGNSAVLGTAQGDLNYDGNVDALDYEQIDLNIGNGVGAPLGTVFVPEPVALAPVILMGVLVARRHR